MKKSQPVSAIEYESPSLLRIFAAMVYDILLLAAVSIAYGAVVVALRVAIEGQPEVGQRHHWSILSGSLVTLGWFALLVFFYAFFWHRFGQTLGMKTWKFQVLDARTYQLPNYKQCVIRGLVAIISLLLLGFGYWCKWIHPQGRTLHDLLSGTALVLLKK